MTDDYLPDDDVSYEPFEDTPWTAADDLVPIDLDALDAEIAGEGENVPAQPGEAAGSLLKAIETLGDDIAPPIPAKPSRRRTAAQRTKPKATPAPEESAALAAESPLPEAAASEASPESAEPAPQAVTEPAPAEVVESAPPDSPAAETAPQPETQAATESPPAEAAESAPEPVAPEMAAAPAEPEEPLLPETVYQAFLVLPPELVAQVRELRKAGQIAAMPPPGVLMIEGFRAADVEAVKAALEKWARAHLPMQLETTGVLAEVVGEAQFVAAWALRPEEELSEAQADLRSALEPLIAPLPDVTPVARVRVTVGDHVAAKRFPQVIGHMQRQFEPVVWHAAELHLVQRQPEAGPDNWAPTATFD